ADGQRGWAVGNGGTILRSIDSGNTWNTQKGGTKETLNSVLFSSDSQRGWTMGGGGTILSTTNGGEAWDAVNLYRREPAPIYSFLLGLTIVPLAFAVRKPSPPRIESESIASIYV